MVREYDATQLSLFMFIICTYTDLLSAANFDNYNYFDYHIDELSCGTMMLCCLFSQSVSQSVIRHVLEFEFQDLCRLRADEDMSRLRLFMDEEASAAADAAADE